jgi:Extensin-like protein C-terminus
MRSICRCLVLADGRKVDVTHGWGLTQRDLAAAEKAKKAASGDSASLPQKKTNTKGTVTEVKVSAAPASNTAANVSSTSEAEAKFLRLAHDGGCKTFSTVLGPEANDAHRTHLHLDLQERKTPVCK